jgi:large subunit ribosomal protein L24
MKSLKKNDKVLVIAGADKGKQGEIIEICNKTNRVKVKGVRVATHYVKARRQGDVSGILKKESFIAVSNVMVMDANSGKPVRLNKVVRA